MSRVARKLVFGVSDQVQHKPGCAASEDRWRLDISDLESRGIALTTKQKTNALICLFVFAYAKSRFSHDKAHIM